METNKDVLVKETNLEIGKTYYFDKSKKSYGIFKGFDKEDESVIFEPKVNNGYGVNKKGFIEFAPLKSSKWILKND
jgi:hypothetical protein